MPEAVVPACHKSAAVHAAPLVLQSPRHLPHCAQLSRLPPGPRSPCAVPGCRPNLLSSSWPVGFLVSVVAPSRSRLSIGQPLSVHHPAGAFNASACPSQTGRPVALAASRNGAKRALGQGKYSVGAAGGACSRRQRCRRRVAARNSGGAGRRAWHCFRGAGATQWQGTLRSGVGSAAGCGAHQPGAVGWRQVGANSLPHCRRC